MILCDYVIALYIRLSVNDKRVESNSIEHQRLLLTKYAENMEIQNIKILEFVDNGYSGTNFERPAIQELLELVRAYQINCIIVKDFSRFGRNIIQTGYFLEQVFPLYHVRFISINENYDSDKTKNNTGGIPVTIQFLKNEYYSRDLSEKSKSAKYSKMQKGEYIQKNCCYGYKKENNTLKIDESVANTAKFILNIVNNCFDKYNELTLKDKKDILNMFVESAYVINSHSVELNFLNTKLEQTLKKWYYNNNLNENDKLEGKEHKSKQVEKATIEICSKSDAISNIFKKVKDKGILVEPLKYDTEKRTFVNEFTEKEKEFADYVKEYREANKMYKKDLAKELGMDESTYIKYENKRLKFQNQDMVNKIIKILGMNEEKVKVPEYIKFLNTNPNEKIKQYMKENNLNIRQFAKIVKVNENTVASWINKGTQISIQTFNKLKKMEKKLEIKKQKNKGNEIEP